MFNTAPTLTAAGEQAERARQRHLVKTHVCAQCFSLLAIEWLDGKWQVGCPKECSPGGFVTQQYAHLWQQQNINDAAEVAANYPQLAPRRKRDPKAARAALFGEE